MLMKHMHSTKHVIEDTKSLDRRFDILQLFQGKLFHENTKGFLVTKQITQKIVGSGLTYKDLQNTYTNFGQDGLIGVLSFITPLKSASKAPRVTKNTRILSCFISHFKSAVTEAVPNKVFLLLNNQ